MLYEATLSRREAALMLSADVFQVHVRFAGRSEDLSFQQLNLRPSATDDELKTALARWYDCAVADLADYVIVREPAAIIVRPLAIYG
jgi:hypothetical protein